MNKPETLFVRATHPDRPCPMIRKHARWDPKTKRDRTLIYHDAPIEVKNVSFYRRAIRRGDLEEVARPSSSSSSRPAPLTPTPEG